MNPKTRDALLTLEIHLDLFMVCLAWILSYHLRFGGLLPVPKGVPDPILYYKLIPFIAGIWLAVLAAAGVYRRARRSQSRLAEAVDVLQGSVLATFAFIAFTWAYDEYRYSRITVGLFAVLSPALMLLGRSFFRGVLRYRRHRAPPRRILLIGSGPALEHTLRTMSSGELAPTEVAGVILVGGEEETGASRVLASASPRYSTPRDWSSFFAEHPFESVVIALPHRHYGYLDQHLEAIANQVGDVRLVPDLFRYTRFAAGVDVVDGMPVVLINDIPLVGMGGILKRLLDIVGSLAGLVLLAPAMAVLALLVKVTSRGPVIYRQLRMGLDGRTFECLKFRSMPPAAEAGTGPVWCTPQDDRPTPIGRFMRRASLDELPQLLNVLRGDMSLVGPRPERPFFVEELRRRVPGYYLRHRVKAGITGWAQVNGWRGNTSIERRIECDLYYIRNWSLWLDLRILLLTLVRGFRSRNAY